MEYVKAIFIREVYIGAMRGDVILGLGCRWSVENEGIEELTESIISYIGSGFGLCSDYAAGSGLVA